MQEVDVIFSIIVLVMSVVIHEVSHGYAALLQGDPTARLAGRLTLNPIKHLDPIGSVVVPIVTSLLPGGFALGWAKPVPYNPYNLRSARWGEALVALAGPVSNIFLALVFGLIIRFGGTFGLLSLEFVKISAIIVITNIVLAVFNLMPVPPLDGSKLLFSVLPNRYIKFREFLERNGLILTLFFVFFIWQIMYPIIPFLFNLLTGIRL
jgi:Zn-dependent protease